jgi:Zinc knuckle
MRKAEMNCYDCGDTGHFAADCPNQGIATSGKTPWCGICDETTRLIDLGDKAGRCTVCHPLRGKQLRQHRKCPRCHVTVIATDSNPCGSHQGPDVPDRRPERETIERVVRTEMENA